jgi:hypothetical protein
MDKLGCFLDCSEKKKRVSENWTPHKMTIYIYKDRVGRVYNSWHMPHTPQTDQVCFFP